MFFRLRHLTVSLCLAGVAACSESTTPTPVRADVYTPGFIFSPFSTTIALGGTVNFHIAGDEHNVIFNPAVSGAPADINVVKDQTLSRTFTSRGTFPYDCTVHPGMSGEIVVR